MRLVTLSFIAFALMGGCSPAAPQPVAPTPPSAQPTKPPPPPAERVRQGNAHFEASRYAKAEAEFAAVEEGGQLPLAQLGLARVELMTGRYQDAVDSAREAAREPGLRAEASTIQAQALRRQGKLEEAAAVLEGVIELEHAQAARILLGEILIERGKREDATKPLMMVIEDWNADVIKEDDGPNLAFVGRAAHLLRSPSEANDAFNMAEEAIEGHIPILLWRAELFLEKHDPGHADEVIQEVLEKAPNHPDALVALAHVKLAQTYDFDEADRLAKRALQTNPKHPGAHFVRAGIALRDMELARADQELDAALAHNARQLDLLSMKAAVRFLADDPDGFDAARDKVLAYNPQFSRLYEIIGEYAEWEHRYDEIVKMMRQAILIDPEDAAARAQLGMNLIRSGDDRAGISQLQRAFDIDPFNVRVYNTLNLYEKVIPQNYESVDHGVFTIRYHKEQKDLLERYLPGLLDEAWDAMVAHYGFTPDTPVGVELYPDREHFSIRTSGLPNTGIQGVCFGRTFASMTPGNETFNVGMTVWHELSHVFHIQLSKSHVPRWFTEGLAEWETLSSPQPEWRRELDPDLYEALRSKRLPEIEQMNRAFTRAEQMSDIATAYYASTKILVMLEKEYGLDKISRMMKLWGEGKRTPEVVRTVLGVSPKELDGKFRGYIKKELVRYNKQFVPIRRTGSLETAKSNAKKHPKDLHSQCLYALALIRNGEVKKGKKVVAKVLEQDPKYPDGTWLQARLLMSENQAKEARQLLERMVQDGHDGFEIRMALAELASDAHDLVAARTALQKAHSYDPLSAEPLAALAELARETKNPNDEIDALRKYVALEEHSARAYQRLMRLLLDHGKPAEAVKVGHAALYVDMDGILTHRLYAEAMAETKQTKQAIFELESALLCPGRPNDKASAHAQLAGVLRDSGRGVESRRHAAQARKLDPDNALLRELKL